MEDADMDEPLDFELEDPLLKPSFVPNKRKKVIGLDDLFNDHMKEQEKGKKKKALVSKAQKCDTLDDDDDDEKTEKELSKAVDDFQQKIKEIDGQENASTERHADDETSLWGLRVFGSQFSPPSIVVPELGGCKLLQIFMKSELCSLVDLGAETGETFLKELLLNGWLHKLIINCGYIEEAISKWTFNLLLYSSEESLMNSACEFWCAILMCDEVGANVVKFEWRPGYSDLRGSLESFGFLFCSSTSSSSDVELISCEFDHKGPPNNIRAWIKFVNACCQARSKHAIFSTAEAEDLIDVLVCLFLDRQLLGLNMLLCDCLLSAINFFVDEEWNISCQRVGKCLAGRVPRDSNSLRMVECVPCVNARSKQLRSTVAFQILILCFDKEVTDATKILTSLISVNLKDKSCELFKMYLYLVLMDNWLICGTNDKPLTDDNWISFLHNCSSQITNTDFRPFAQEIRNRASYLLQSIGTV